MTAKGTTTYRQHNRPYREDRKRRNEPEDRPKKKWGFAFCFLFTNQAGTVILSFSGVALMITTMLVHWYAPSLTSAGVKALQNLLLHIYFLVMLTGFVLAFVAAYIEKGILAKVAALLVLIGTVLYLIFFILSFLTESMVMLYVCPEMRCPDHHWLQDSMWRGYVIYSENIDRYRNIEKEIRKIEEKINSVLERELASNEFNNSYQYVFLQDMFSKTKPEENKHFNCSLLAAENVTGTVTERPNPNDDQPPSIGKGHYIRLMSPGNEGKSILIVISIFFGLMIIGASSELIDINQRL
ncbi:unnamed protein product [Nezara viridula]|uniref:Uncharacterized protein n=1 Tax=Nezara viridula TaxID=85310 RepID=A0A9P0HNW5_NEZVI|nr:unnamed protein product [Nezara viridula]